MNHIELELLNEELEANLEEHLASMPDGEAKEMFTYLHEAR